MSQRKDSRAGILGRIRAATQKVAVEESKRGAVYASLSRPYVHAGARSRQETVELMIERLRGYDAEVVETRLEELPATIAARLTASGRKRFVTPPGLPETWKAAGFEFMVDTELEHAEIEKAEGVVTASFCGIADSGTIVLHHSASEGRRVLSLLPDFHLCVLRRSQIVETLPEYFARAAQIPSLATLISGPSATADIEMTRIKGVHGPRFLEVVVVNDEEAS